MCAKAAELPLQVRETAPMRAVPKVDGFVDLAEIGRGGFSEVYAATQEVLERRVAIKVIDAAGSASRRLEREARVLGALSEIPNVITAFQISETEDGRPCLIMRLMPMSLKSVMDADGPVALVHAVRWARQLGNALDAAHERGIVHRDVKPQNVLLSSDGDAYLADFGIAALQGRSDATTTAMSLSPPFAPPERFEGTGDRPRAGDIYSLAATIYAALAGRAPFGTAEDGGTHGLLNRIVAGVVPPVPGVSPAVNDALASGMSVRPDDRPPTASEFAARLEAAASDTSTTVKRIPPLVSAPTVVGMDESDTAKARSAEVEPEAPPPTTSTLESDSGDEKPESPVPILVRKHRHRISWVVLAISAALVANMVVQPFGYYTVEAPDGQLAVVYHRGPLTIGSEVELSGYAFKPSDAGAEARDAFERSGRFETRSEARRLVGALSGDAELDGYFVVKAQDGAVVVVHEHPPLSKLRDETEATNVRLDDLDELGRAAANASPRFPTRADAEKYLRGDIVGASSDGDRKVPSTTLESSTTVEDVQLR